MGEISRRRAMLGATSVVGFAAAGLPRQGRAAAEPDGGPAFGPVTVGPSDPRYLVLNNGMNQRWIGRPDYVRMVGSTAQVVAAVNEAVRAGKRVAVRSGGHCYTDFVFNPDVRVVIDMSEMSKTYFDPERAAFVIEPGATLLKVYENLYRGYGVAPPAGLCYSVGAGGHICGGGYGMLSRQFGLIVDHLDAVEVVVVDGHGTARAVVATRAPDDPNRDLWWAHTGGGGGNFGVVTRYWLRSPNATGHDPAGALPNPPGEVFLNVVSWDWAKITEPAFVTLVRNYQSWLERNSAPDAASNRLFGFLKLNHVSNGKLNLIVQTDATAPDARRLHTDFIAAVSAGVGVAPEPFTPQRMPWLHAAQRMGTGNPTLNDPTLRGHYKSAYHRQGFTDDQLATAYRHLSRPDYVNPTALLLLASFGGRINAPARTDTAVVQRNSIMKLLYSVNWSAAADDELNIGWARNFYRDVYAGTGGVPVPDGRTDGCYVNYADTDISDPAWNTSGVPWSTLYYGENYDRLRQVKARWDPLNIFRHRQSIELP